MIRINPAETDAPEFMATTEAILLRIESGRPRQIYVVRIENWFGRKWAGFAGKVMGALGVAYFDDLVVPPFVPNRVTAQSCYELSSATGEYSLAGRGSELHLDQTSSQNLRRKVAELFPGVAFLWFSSNSAVNGRGSVMAYVPSPSGHERWFVEMALGKTRGWHASHLIGPTRADLESFTK